VAPGEGERARIFDLSGGALCLNFANTLDDRPGARQNEFRRWYVDLLAFARPAGVLPESILDRLKLEASRLPDEAAAALSRAIGSRETIYRSFLAHAEVRPISSADVAGLNVSIGMALAQPRIVQTHEGVLYRWG